jgi:hypothetical protein
LIGAIVRPENGTCGGTHMDIYTIYAFVGIVSLVAACIIATSGPAR